MAVDDVQSDQSTDFPSIGICEVGYAKEVYPKLEDIINSLVSYF